MAQTVSTKPQLAGETLNLYVAGEDGTILWQMQMPPGVREIVLVKPADDGSPGTVYTRCQIYDDGIMRKSSQRAKPGALKKFDEEHKDEDELLSIYRTEVAQ